MRNNILDVTVVTDVTLALAVASGVTTYVTTSAS